MIVVDIETSGKSFIKCGIWQIGAVDLDTKEEFLEEGRIDDDEIISKEALEIVGKTEKELRNRNKQSQKELIENFFIWIRKRKVKTLIGHNFSFDKSFLEIKSEKYNLNVPFSHRTFDLHTIAQIKFFELNKKFFNKEDNKSNMGLGNVLKLCGFSGDPRGSHNALEDAKLTAECFSRLVYGKNLLEEYSKFEVPNFLKNNLNAR
jgi:DNA polymerase III epsilon subunit-like protein